MHKSFLAFLVLLSFNVQAQFSAGVGFGFSETEDSESDKGINIRLGYQLGKKWEVIGSFTYMLSRKVPSVVALKEIATGQIVSRIGTASVKSRMLNLQMNYRFLGQEEKGFSFYGIIGISFYPRSTENDPYAFEQDKYTLLAQYDYASRNTFRVLPGLGLSYMLRGPRLFTEFTYGLSPGQGRDPSLGGQAAVHVGILFPVFR
jgi:opacity protein-like surface antigen